MSSQTIAAWAVVGVMLLGTIGGLLALTFNIGALKGQLTSFIQTSERDRSEQLKDIGKLEERWDRHLEVHHGGTR